MLVSNERTTQTEETNECKLLRLGGTSGVAGSDAGSGATLPVSGIDIPLPGTKPEVAGSRNSEFQLFFANT